MGNAEVGKVCKVYFVFRCLW